MVLGFVEFDGECTVSGILFLSLFIIHMFIIEIVKIDNYVNLYVYLYV